jgi:hypothetical protein
MDLDTLVIEVAFPIYWVPQRVGRPGTTWQPWTRPVTFPIYWVPQRVGRKHT